MIHYADTSVLCSIYSSDANSSKVDLWRLRNPFSLPFTALHRVELRNAFRLSTFQKRYSTADMTAAWKAVEADVAAQVLEETSLDFGDLLRAAELMIDDHTEKTGARSLDILHVAAASFWARPSS